jgi:putative transposase
VNQTLTISCKLQVTPEVAPKIDATLRRFAEACEWINANTPGSLTNKTGMQALVYKDVRAKFGMSANLTIQAVRRVCANRKTAKQKNKQVKGFKPTSVSYDARIFSFREKDWTVSLTLLECRERFKLLIGNYQRHYLKGQEPTSATLVKKQSGEYYIQIQIESDVPEIQDTDKVLGVDLGRTDIVRFVD